VENTESVSEKSQDRTQDLRSDNQWLNQLSYRATYTYDTYVIIPGAFHKISQIRKNGPEKMRFFIVIFLLFSKRRYSELKFIENT
jgi:hypothetical protein